MRDSSETIDTIIRLKTLDLNGDGHLDSDKSHLQPKDTLICDVSEKKPILKESAPPPLCNRTSIIKCDTSIIVVNHTVIMCFYVYIVISYDY